MATRERDGNIAPCRNLLQYRTCRYGAHCRYSHDPIYSQRGPTPASTPCFHWEEKGTCPYGAKCAYKHNDCSGLSSIRDGLLEEMASFERPQHVHDDSTGVQPVIDCLASYAWLDIKHPTIALPGMEDDSSKRIHVHYLYATLHAFRSQVIQFACDPTASPFDMPLKMRKGMSRTHTDSSH